jgi:hypothetical protein
MQVMSTPQTTRRALPGWLAGLLAATSALVALGFVTLGFFASGGGLVIAGGAAIAIGSLAPWAPAATSGAGVEVPGRRVYPPSR